MRKSLLPNLAHRLIAHEQLQRAQQQLGEVDQTQSPAK